MKFDPQAIRDAAKLIGCHPADLKRSLEKTEKPNRYTKLKGRRSWIAKARKIILSVPPEYNAERLAEKLYSTLVIGGGHR